MRLCEVHCESFCYEDEMHLIIINLCIMYNSILCAYIVND